MSALTLDYNEKPLGGAVIVMYFCDAPEEVGQRGKSMTWTGSGSTIGEALAELTCDLAQHPLGNIHEAWHKMMTPKEALTPAKVAALEGVQL